MPASRREESNKLKSIWHVNFATRGAAGAYMDALLRASAQAGVSARGFVSLQYTFETPGAIKWFFPISDLTERRRLGIMLLRAVELCLGYSLILLLASV